jgi:hypothetical protein
VASTMNARFEVIPNLPDHWLLCCRSCGHTMGNTTALGRGPEIAYHSVLPGLVWLGDTVDGLPRYGLRRGAFLRGREPLRRPSPWESTYYPYTSPGVRMALRNSAGQSNEPKFYAYCVNCRALNLVDTTDLRGSE